MSERVRYLLGRISELSDELNEEPLTEFGKRLVRADMLETQYELAELQDQETEEVAS